MSFYLRKSVKAGPFRMNLSKSGVGVSAGVPGFRVGSGPRGNYVRIGAGGVYYRSTQPPAAPPAETWFPPPPAPVGEVLLEDVTGASASELVPGGPGEIVEQLKRAASRWLLWPWAAVLLLVVLAASPIAGAVLLVPGLPGVIWLWFNDRARRTVVAFYDVNDSAVGWFQGLLDAAEGLARNQGLWRINAEGNVQSSYQYKVNAGATTIVSRSTATASQSPPPHLATNIAVPSITAGRSGLYFLPDRVLIKDAKRYSDISYAELSAQATPMRFTESGRVPGDAQQIDTTWQYVNVRGGPDRRFKDNRQYPVMLYGELRLTSPGGLHWIVQCSQPACAEGLAEALCSAPKLLARQES
jgi:DNA polymerase III subunit epsilon